MKTASKEVHWFECLPEDKKKAAVLQNDGKTVFNFHKHADDAAGWVDSLACFLEIQDRKEWAYHALRGGLFALRDRMTPEEVFQLSAQMPMVIRGLFLEGYKVHGKPEKLNKEEFLARIETELQPPNEIDAETAFEAILYILYHNISEGEMEDIYATMPKDIRKLWDRCLDRILS